VYDDVPLFLGLINDLFPGMPSYSQQDRARHGMMDSMCDRSIESPCRAC